MIVIAGRVGRLANRMLLFSHLIAAGCEHGFKVANPGFEHYARYFPATSRNLIPRFPPGRPFIAAPRIVRKAPSLAARVWAEALWRLEQRGHDVGLIRLTRDQYVDLNSDFFVSRAGRHRVLVIQDWFFRNGDNVERHAGTVRSFFRPHPRHLERALAAVEPARADGRLVVGVHIRRGDYRRFKGGRFFFSHDVYRRAMHQTASAHPHRAVSFLVCSDELVPAGAFAGLDLLRAPGHEVQDLYALASCDLLIGPPSTYTTWASFWGEVPSLRLQGPDQNASSALFQVERRLAWEPIPELPSA